MSKRRLILAVALSLTVGLSLGQQVVAEGSSEGRIAFQGSASGLPGRQIFVVDPDGTNRLQLTNDQSRDFRRPTWSPDGRLIAAYTSDGPQDHRVVVFDLTGAVKSEFAVPSTSYVVWSNHELACTLLAAENQLLVTAEGNGGSLGYNNLVVRDFQGNVKVQLTDYVSDESNPEAALYRGAVDSEWLGDGPDEHTARLWYLYREITYDAVAGQILSEFIEHRVMTLDTNSWPSIAVVSETAAPDMPLSLLTPGVSWTRGRDKIAWSDTATWPGFTVAPVTFDTAGLPIADLGNTIEVAETDLYPKDPSFTAPTGPGSPSGTTCQSTITTTRSS